MAMFSNSNDVFRTQADTRFNSFADPQNSVNQNGGGWGIDSNYLTPSYTSPFRPQYQGPNGNTYGRGSPPWGQAFNQTIWPFATGGSNYGGNYWQQTAPYFDSLVNRPMDNTASFMQNWVVPGLATFAAYKYLGKGADRIGGAFGVGVTRGLFGLMGSAAQSGTAMTAGRALGGMAGSLFLPALAAQGASMAFDSAVADPYIAQRQMGRSMRDNFSGINFGEGVGDRFTGGGLSRSFAQGLAGKMSKAGANDMTFTQQETAQLTDMSSRAGLLDNVSASGMADRFEKIMKQVKVVMSIANTSDFQETIQIMSKLQMSGVNPNALSGAMGTMSALAGAGGLSMQKTLNTTGAQGQYMFGAAGLTPYTGTATGFAASAAHSAAYRSGLVSPAMMARMGGIEGASQSSVGGTIGMYSSPYASMMASNAYRPGGGEMGNFVSNMSSFGGHIAGNPLQNIGSHMALGKAKTSKMIEERGMQGIQDMIVQAAKTIPGGMKNGKVTSEIAYLIMTEMYQIAPDQATALLNQFSSIIDPKTSNAMLGGINTASINAISKYRQQEGLDKGVFTTPYNAVKHGAMAIQSGGASVVSSVMETMGSAADSIENTINRTVFGVDETENGMSMEKARSMSDKFQVFGDVKKGSKPGLKGNDIIRTNRALGSINEAIASGDPDAIKFLKSAGRERMNALDKLVAKGVVHSSFGSSAEAAKLGQLADVSMLVDQSPDGEIKTPGQRLQEKLDMVHKGGDLQQTLDIVTLSDRIKKTLDAKGTVSDEDRNAYAAAHGLSGDSLTDAKMRELSSDEVKKAANAGVYHIAGRKAGNMADLISGMDKDGVPLLAPKIAGDDLKAVSEQTDVQKAMIKTRSRLLGMRKNNLIDDSTYLNTTNSLDNKEAVGKFAEAVDKFVGGVNGAKPANGVSNPNGVPSMKEYFLDGKRIQKN